MHWKRICALFLLFAIPFLSAAPTAAAQGEALSVPDAAKLVKAQQRTERALLIGIDNFVSKPSIYPGSTNNVYAMQEAFQAALTPLRALILPQKPVTSAQQLTQLIRETFTYAKEGDVSYFYISTHGVYDPATGQEPMLLLSDGITEGGITPSQLEAAFDGIPGTKVLILDACNSGAFIGKGQASRTGKACFLGDDFKVLTSSGAMEESWYWSAEDTQEQMLTGGEPQGAFYFTQALVQSLSPAYSYPADQNHDGSITLLELYHYLLANHAASTPQVYPQSDDFVVFRYDITAPPPTGLDRAPVMDVTFSGTMLSQSMRQITIEFTAMRPVRVAYQIVYQHEGKWQFDKAQLIYDEAERFTAFGDRAGAVSAGRKVRTLSIDEMAGENHGYVLVQLVTIDQGKLTVQAGRVLCVPPAAGELNLAVSAEPLLDRAKGGELSLFVRHDYPCALSVAIVDQEDKVVYRLCHRESTRPMQLNPVGSVFYWDGKKKDGTPASAGVYRARVQATMNEGTVTVYSEPFTLQ
ncbi:MAG: caspase family protein [Clostridia bacterium]